MTVVELYLVCVSRGVCEILLKCTHPCLKAHVLVFTKDQLIHGKSAA